MKWVLSHVIYLHRWSERWDIYWCYREDCVLDGGIKVVLLLAKLNWFICDVITDYHIIGRKRNRTINQREMIFPSKWSGSSVIYLHRWSVADPRFPWGGGTKSWGGTNIRFCQISPKNCRKLRQLDGSLSRKWRDRSRAKRNTVYTFRWWTVASDRCASFKQIDGQIKNRKRNCLYFAMMICCQWSIFVVQTNWCTDREPKEKIFILFHDDLLLQTDVSPSNKLMDRSRTERENVSTLRWWSVPVNRCESFNEIDGQMNNRRRNFLYFAIMISLRKWRWVLSVWSNWQ